MPSRIARLFVCCLLLVASSTDVSAAPQPGPLHDEAVVRMLASGRDARPLAAQASADDAQSRARALALREQPAGPSVRVAEAAAAVADAAGSINDDKAHPAALEAALDRLAVADRLLRAGYPMHAESPIALALGLRETLQQRAADTVARWDSALRPLLAAGKALRGTPNAKAASLQLERQLAEVLLSDSRAKTSPNLQLPVHRPGLAPPALSDGNSITPSYADPRDPLPLDEDLLASGEVQFTQPVLQKAQQLGYRYVDLFDFVRSSVRTEWSAGSTQSPERSLRRLAGNDVEQASLLIALLRASGAAARYVHGVVEVPASDLAQQMGVPQAQLGRALTLAGIAHRPRLSAGRVVAYQIRHTWVSARVPYGNYRGSVADTSEPTWIPLMPALKPAAFQAGTSVLERVPQDIRAWLQAYLAGTQGEP
jgi:transglutaminase-like putative cysteine protease